MARIQVLDSETIDKIAAGEVVERPASVVKELVENAIDAGATAVTVEIKEGGISFIRVTDNGCGIPREELQTAFMRHATSKIASAEDLFRIHSLGFRGEALSSIGAVAKVEMMTKTKEALTGTRYVLEGAIEKEMEEIGAPNGTTMLVRNLFFNTPVRRKFLKQPVTEGGYVTDLLEHMAFCRPDVSFKYVINGQTRFHTSGNGDLKEVIYRIHGREAVAELIELSHEENGMKVTGYIGKPALNRANRNCEIYYINGRYIKSTLMAKAIEEGFKGFLMQHKYPYCILHFEADTQTVDVNVHPSKMEVRFTEGNAFYDFIMDAVSEALNRREMIPEVGFSEENKQNGHIQDIEKKQTAVPEPFETKRLENYRVEENSAYHAEPAKMQDFMQNPLIGRVLGNPDGDSKTENEKYHANIIKSREQIVVEKPVQLELFEEKLLTKEAKDEYNILGQIFDTYWLMTYKDKLFIIDQHAAHEKVKYEKLLKQFHNAEMVSQTVNPPVIVTLTGREETLLLEYRSVFQAMGFEIEAFGGSEYALRSIPAELYGCQEKEMLEQILEELSEGSQKLPSVTVVEEKIASMACKAAVKGNHSMSVQEMKALMEQLMELENPYACPHGRPTIIAMSKYEIEKKFKRIV